MPISVEEAIATLEAAVPHPEKGFPRVIFDFLGRNLPLTNVDLLIQDGEGRALLTWREDERYGPGWHLPGGVIRFKERAIDRINAVALEELGTTVGAEDEPVFVSEAIVEQRQRGHSISLLYRCILTGDPDESLRAQDPPRNGQWKWHESFPDNIIPEQKIFKSYFF